MQIFQKGFNFMQDGQGNRLVYHMCGCNLCCPWCANPEGLFSEGEKISTCEIVSEAKSCKAMFFGGGGVTFTGGEPTCQFCELKEALTALKAHKIHTCIETNGTHEELPMLFPLIDQFIMDLKHVKEYKIKEIGGDFKIIDRNLKAAASFYEKLWIRVPLIKYFNADYFKDFQTYLSNFNNIVFEVLPYHEFGKKKWEDLGKKYTVSNGTVSSEEIEKWKSMKR